MFSLNQKRRHACSVLAFVAIVAFWAGAVSAQTTSFTYQGKLTDGGMAANGSYDLQFALWDSATSFTANAPLVGNGTRAVSVGSRSGTTTTFATTSGALASSHCVQIDSSGNLVDSGAGQPGGAGDPLKRNSEVR